jgi:hypothetical protein
MNEIKPNQKINYYPYSFELKTTQTPVLTKLPPIIATERTVIDNYTPVIRIHEEDEKDDKSK